MNDAASNELGEMAKLIVQFNDRVRRLAARYMVAVGGCDRVAADSNGPLHQAYSVCLSALSFAERDDLLRLIHKMSSAFDNQRQS
jgi:hypothetical protein